MDEYHAFNAILAVAMAIALVLVLALARGRRERTGDEPDAGERITRSPPGRARSGG